MREGLVATQATSPSLTPFVAGDAAQSPPRTWAMKILAIMATGYTMA